MDENEERRLSLIPYSSESQQVVLRHGDSVVLYDEKSRQLITATQTDDSVASNKIHNCPYCRRPLSGSAEFEDEPSLDSQRAPSSFVSPSYFRMLQHSRPASSRSSQNPSPRYHLLPTETLQSGTPPKQHSPGRFNTDSKGTPPRYQGISASSFSQGYYKKFFVEEQELGRGGKGVVFLVRHLLDGVDLGQFACKRVPVGNDHVWLERALHEVAFLQNVSHENLVSYRHVWLESVKLSKFGPSVPCAYILQQYCNSGDLHNHILGSTSNQPTAEQLKDRVRKKSRGQSDGAFEFVRPKPLHFDQILSFFRDISLGLRHLHANGYVHRDLKPNNCLLHLKEGKLRVLVSDFGEMQGANVVRKGSGGTGSLAYSAPEVLKRDRAGEFGDFTKKSDVFSLGMVLHFMCFGRLPYTLADEINAENEDLEQLRAEICAWVGIGEEQQDRTDLPEQLYQTLKLLLSIDPTRRPTMEDIVQGIKSVSHSADRSAPASPVERKSHISDEFDDRHSPMESPHQEYFDTKSTFPSQTDPDSTARIPRYRRRPSEDPYFVRNRMKPNHASPNRQGDDAVVVARRQWSPPLQNRQPPRLMLPPPRDTSMTRHFFTFMNLPTTVRVVRALIFLSKLWFTSQLCGRVATSPFALLFLFSVAAVDLAGFVDSFAGSAVLVVAHFALVLALVRMDSLCDSPTFNGSMESI